LKLFKLTLRVESPTIVAERGHRSGFKSLKHIPGQTLRGAVISALYRDGVINDKRVSEESKEPTVIASPAYPLFRNKQALPAHPFIYKCKACGRVHDSLKESLDSLAKNKVEELILVTCPTDKGGCGKPAVKSLYGKPITDTLEEARVATFAQISVAISKGRGAAEVGMLYSNEVLAVGQHFWATLVLPDDLEPPSELRVGRGISRGFGRFSVKTQKISETELQRRADNLAEYIMSGGRRLVFYAVSPLVEVSLNSATPNISKIYLNDVARLVQPEIGKVRLRIFSVLGQKSFVTGWDVKENRPRPPLPSAGAGSLVVADVENGKPDEAALGLTWLRFIGTVEYLEVRNAHTLYTGVNMLQPIASYKEGFAACILPL